MIELKLNKKLINHLLAGNCNMLKEIIVCQGQEPMNIVVRLTRRVRLVEQELFTLPEDMSSPPVLVGFVLLDL